DAELAENFFSIRPLSLLSSSRGRAGCPTRMESGYCDRPELVLRIEANLRIPGKAPMIRAGLTRWLQGPPLTGAIALLCGVVAVALPTVIRAAVNGVVTGCEFTPYLPFVLLSAILLRWWQAGAVALVSVAILGGLFTGVVDDLSCFTSSAGIFLASSVMMIGTVILVRRVTAILLSRGADETSGGIVFSLEEGEVWASWYGEGPPMRLGPQQSVSRMMEDFLAQEEVARRFAGRR
ncbi:MAG: hypothetical protein ACXWUP_04810, partial [Allosphingosinicella sp.]